MRWALVEGDGEGEVGGDGALSAHLYQSHWIRNKEKKYLSTDLQRYMYYLKAFSLSHIHVHANECTFRKYQNSHLNA